MRAADATEFFRLRPNPGIVIRTRFVHPLDQPVSPIGRHPLGTAVQSGFALDCGPELNSLASGQQHPAEADASRRPTAARTDQSGESASVSASASADGAGPRTGPASADAGRNAAYQHFSANGR